MISQAWPDSHTWNEGGANATFHTYPAGLAIFQSKSLFHNQKATLQHSLALFAEQS